MASIHPQPVISGVPYPVTGVGDDGGRPSSLDDFVGTTAFTVEMRGGRVVEGSGSFDGKSVRFYEKNAVGKDVRIWRITALPDGVFMATHEAAW